MLLVGSEALSVMAVRVFGREPADIDLIGTFDTIGIVRKGLIRSGHKTAHVIPISRNKSKIIPTTVRESQDARHIEIEIAWPGSTGEELLAIDQWGTARFTWGETFCASLYLLYTLKMSHRFLKNSPHFHKTRNDILKMRDLGAKIFDEGWLKRREKETYWYAHPKLNTSKKDFFETPSTSAVKYIFDHDSIHEMVANRVHAMPPRMSRPAYESYKSDNAEVLCDRGKWEALDQETRLRGVAEEAYVLALERSQIPYGDLPAFMLSHPAYEQLRPDRSTPTPRWSFETALIKVCTSITSGWFRDFAWWHFDEVMARFDPTYTNKFWLAAYRREVKLAK